VKPEARITQYLFAKKAKIQFSTIDLVVKDVKLSVFYGMSPIPDDAIREIVAHWAVVNAAGLLLRQPAGGSPPTPPPGTPSTAPDSALLDEVKKAVSTVVDGVTIGKKGANVNIAVSGLTANLKKGETSATLGVSWGGTLKLDAASGAFHFSGSLA
jgi:hypothetical protein